MYGSSLDGLQGPIPSVLRQTQTSIRPAKAKAVSERNIYPMLLGDFRDVVAIELLWRITRAIQVERRWHYALQQSRQPAPSQS